MNVQTKKATRVVKLSEFRQRLREEILATCDMRSAVGRPRKLLLGRKSQMHRLIAQEIADRLFLQISAEGATVDIVRPNTEHEIDLSKDVPRKRYATEQLRAMAAIDRTVTDEDPFICLERMFGSIIKIGSERVVISGSARKTPVYISTMSATPAELRIFADSYQKRGRNEMALTDKVYRDVHAVIDQMAEGECLESAMARHFDAIRAGAM